MTASSEEIALQKLFIGINEIDQKTGKTREDFDDRANLIYQALGIASKLKIPCGIRIDYDEPDWPVVVFDLPTGQVAWHMKTVDIKYDGHPDKEKQNRIEEYCYGWKYRAIEKYSMEKGQKIQIDIINQIYMETSPPRSQTIFNVKMGDVECKGSVNSCNNEEIRKKAYDLLYNTIFGI